ncbi:STY4528 family pathogenicity island replication protein [Gallibacterium anatis]|uniref:STY4528 family pathogenicity island replication protein n=1 Tax=Gallibacterium anatis TaxID=750 RepID=A0AAX3XID1_9PAST|nr:STY4528 family pathogenicity island replication protein [Gallibacterium anatis]MDK9430406.1 STY4528 family pathogenicity island replication protein [Gallibacterium anatis]WIM80786.1 STY4528 family pathogenicity island replication protein [Gallibacterium anatis]
MTIFEQITTSPNIEQGLLFFGNQHETVPTRLLYDPYLTPRAKFAWQLIKHKAREFQGGLFPSYEVLGKLLSDKPYLNASLSRKTVSQTLLLLRLTRWLTLCETVRNELGQVKGNVYLLHDEPIPILDAIQLNEDYLHLLHSSTKHKDVVVRGVATHIVDNILSDKTQWHYVSHIDWMQARYQDYCSRLGNEKEADFSHLNLDTVQQNLLSSNKERSQNSKELSEKTINLPSSIKELSQHDPSSNRELSQEKQANSLILGSVPLGNSANTSYKYSTVFINKYCTGTPEEIDWTLNLIPFEKRTVAKAMEGLDLGLCQAILFEAGERLAKGTIKKPQGYLLSLVRKAHLGQFNPYLLEQHLSQSNPSMINKSQTHMTVPERDKTPSSVPTLEQRQARAAMIRKFKAQLLN